MGFNGAVTGCVCQIKRGRVGDGITEGELLDRRQSGASCAANGNLGYQRVVTIATGQGVRCVERVLRGSVGNAVKRVVTCAAGEVVHTHGQREALSRRGGCCRCNNGRRGGDIGGVGHTRDDGAQGGSVGSGTTIRLRVVLGHCNLIGQLCRGAAPGRVARQVCQVAEHLVDHVTARHAACKTGLDVGDGLRLCRITRA